MDSLAFNDAVNQLEVSCGVHIPADSRAVAQKIFQVYGKDLSVAEGALGLLRHASIKLVTNLDLDIEEIMLEEDEFCLDRAFVEVKELERDLNSQRSFYLSHVHKEYNTLEEKWKKFVQKWLPISVKSFCEIDDRVALLFKLGLAVCALTSQELERVDNIHHMSSEASRIHAIIDQLGRTFHVDYWKIFVVSPNMIIELASSSVRIPPSHLSRQLNLTPEGVRTPFYGTSIGLDHIISFIVETILKKKPSGGPLGSFLLLGCHGRGRTELARALAKQLFDHEDMLVLCDMSDYHDANSGPRFRDDLCGDTLLGKLVDISKKKAYGILIFANIEKASPSVLGMIVSILDEGIFKNCDGTLFDLTAVLVLMKSNAGNDVFLRSCCCLDNVWKVKQIISGHQQLQVERKHQCYYMPFLEKTSKNFNSEFLDHLDEVLVLPYPSPLQYSEIARIQLRKLIPEMLSPMLKKVIVYLSQAALLLDIGALMDNGGHAAKEWLETEIGPELQKSWGDGIEDLSVVYVDVLVGTFQLSCRVENTGHLLNDKVYGKFRKTLMNLRKMHYRNKQHVKMIHKLGMYAHDVPYNAELMVRIIDEMLKEAFDFKKMLGNLDFFDWEEECQQQMRIQEKAKHNYMDNFSKFCYKFVESNQATRIIQALLESMRDVPPVKEHFQRPHSFLFLGLHRGGREDLTAGLSKCYAPESSMTSVIEVDLSLCTEPDSFFRCTCKGKPGDLFVDAMRARSRSIIVFYDFEIAHISVFSNILSILDHGFLSDKKGDDIYFHNSIIIFVSRCGNREMISALFRVLDDDRIDDTREGLRFRTEFLNRLDEIVLFFPFRHQQFDVVERLPVSGLPEERRNEFSIMIHSLFHSGKDVSERKIRFTSNHSPKELLDRIEDTVIQMGFHVQKKNGKLKVMMDSRSQNASGSLSVAAEVFEISPSLYVVELRKECGDPIVYRQLCDKSSNELGVPQSQEQPALTSCKKYFFTMNIVS